ncbi:MAG: DNA methyltransferase [Gammaproteobacteria bacterium]
MQLDRTIYNADNLLVMSRMPSDSVDLIYLDPPFNTGKQWENPLKETGKKVSFKDTWTLADIHEDDHEILQVRFPEAAAVIETLGYVNGGSWQAYLTYMGVRLVQMHRLLKPTGSIYYHCDPVMSHGVKLMMDAIFGKDNFRNEIVWNYRRMPAKQAQFQSMHDIILFYSKGADKHYFDAPRGELTASSVKAIESACKRGYNVNKKKKMATVWDWDKFNAAVKAGILPKGLNATEAKNENRPYLPAVWDMPILSPTAKERVGHPTEKPIALLSRIIGASSRPGDLVLDPFCGCGVTAAASELFFDERRRWVGIDVATDASDVLRRKLNKCASHLFGDIGIPKVRTLKVSDLPDLPPIPKRKAVMEILHKGQGGKCRCCEKPLTGQHPEIDHLRPKAKGGDNHLSNLHLLCRECHKKKGTKTMTDTRRRVIAENAAASMEKWRQESAAALAKEKTKAIAKAEKQKRKI